MKIPTDLAARIDEVNFPISIKIAIFSLQNSTTFDVSLMLNAINLFA